MPKVLDIDIGNYMQQMTFSDAFFSKLAKGKHNHRQGNPDSTYFFDSHLFICYIYILTDFNYATLTSPDIFQKTVECKLPWIR